MSEQNNVQQYVEMHEERFAAFSRVYAERNPPPQMSAVESTDWITLGALGVLVLASVVVSGSRTIAEFGGGLIGAAAFVMLELAMIAYAYWRAKRLHKPERNRASSAGMWIAFGVSLAANVHATLGASHELPAWIGTLITLALAISAPTLALIAGDMLGREAVAAIDVQSANRQAFDLDLAAWQQERNKAWDRAKTAWGVRLDGLQPVAQINAVAPPPSLPEAVSPNGSREVHEPIHEKTPRVKLHEVAAIVHERGDGNLSTEEMMSKYGISAGGTSKVRAMLESMNGNGGSDGSK